ncbi:MAG TPA: DUF5597 domain-containing protein [Mucilaginibacter sp.]
MKKFYSCILIFLVLTISAYAQQASPLPKIMEKDGRHTLLVNGKPFLILGGQAHNSSGWPAMLPNVWTAIKQMHANTLEIPIYWEQIEPQRGVFNFSLIDTLLTQARHHNVRLVLLWFATWKNGSNHYMPEWMKRDAAKYPNISGQNNKLIDSPSPHSEATLEADRTAFAAVMRYLKKADMLHTVIMVQVENEPGSWDSVRDYSAIGERLFQQQVPADLLKPEVLKALDVPVVSGGSWQQVFGDRADEYFQAWSISSFIGKVAAAGKAEYTLPLYVNAALRNPLTNPHANSYESGGPTDNVIPIWKAAAPAVDLLAPDIYLDGSERVLKVIGLYNRADNPLFVPEAGLTTENAKYIYPVIANGGIGFSPFGIDHIKADDPNTEVPERLAAFGNEYEILAPMAAQLADWGFQGKIKAVVEHEDHAPQTIDLGAWQAVVLFGTGGRNPLNANTKPIGKIMIVQTDHDKFIVIGTNCRINFKPSGANSGKAWQYLKVEEGQYHNGTFKSQRILNGDETDWGGPAFGNTPVVLRISLIIR